MAVVCLGEALIDLVPPHGESPETAPHLSIAPGGAPLNIAVGLSRLGFPSLFMGSLSNDAFGRRLAMLLEGEGVPRRPEDAVDNPTRLAVIDHLDQRSPFHFYGDTTADTMLDAAEVEAALNEPDVTGIYVGSLMMTNTRARDVQSHALNIARNRGIPVFTDPNPRPAAWPSREAMIEATTQLIAASRLAKLSLDDAEVLGWPTDPFGLLTWCADRFDAQIFLTGGAQGCWTMRDSGLIAVPAPVVDVRDPTGAGDASFAALIYQFQMKGAVGHDELRFAAASGALATQKHGAIAGLPSRAAVLEMLHFWVKE